MCFSEHLEMLDCRVFEQKLWVRVRVKVITSI